MKPMVPFVMVITVLVALWPVACSVATLWQVFAKRWRHVALLSLLVPLWAIAPLALISELAASIPAPDAPEPSSAIHSALMLGLAACCAFGSWCLLIRSFRNHPTLRNSLQGSRSEGDT